MRALLATFAAGSLAPLTRGDPAKPVDFSRDILPVLSDTCYQCHGPDAKAGKGKLRLDDEADVKRPRDGYRVVVAGDPKASALMDRVTTSDPDDRMPPAKLGRTLSPMQITTLRRWIEQGAVWGKHWAFERVERPAIADAKTHPIDYLVEQRLNDENLSPNARASRETRIRRLSLDLTGLPATPKQVDAFLADTKPGAWERLVDRTLASPAYGERMAWDWLEAARYADTNGYQGDNERTMWPWRDWVVRAFNANLPYDQFTIWQLAGDLLPNATREQILATGFNRNHMINGEGGRIAEENRVDYVFDMTETMGTIWLGLTLNCCRCHDHKFDPLLQRDYYRFTAFFNQTPVNGGGGNAQTPPVIEFGSATQAAELAAARAATRQAAAAVQQRVEALEKEQAAWESKTAQDTPASPWQALEPLRAKANKQTLDILDRDRVYASGANPPKDAYEIAYGLAPGEVSGFKLDAIRHPKMTHGGLARSDSGNFVLTDIRFRLNKPDGPGAELEISGAQASFEQGNLKIENTYDKKADSGWAVWAGKPIDRDHAAVFRLKQPVHVQANTELLVSLTFNSKHPQHNLGHFRLSATDAAKPALDKAEDALQRALSTPHGQRNTEQKKRIREALLASDPEWKKLKKQGSDAEAKIKSLSKGLPKVMVMKERDKPRPTYVLTRGLYNQKGEEVQAAVPAALPPLANTESTNRLALARWLVSREHPLTARVTVNRFWQMLFGIGLVKTPEDFGVQGEFPVQRELLDWLAVDFIESGWDVKQLLRTIVSSETYQRSSIIATPAVYERDPQNRLLARGPRFRMPSWMLRDQALAAAGLLHPEIGGAPVKSYQPAGVWAEATFGKKKYQVAKGQALYRRSLYTFWRRIVGPTMFFDTAKRQICEVKPFRTNTPMHALSTLNDITYVEAARAMAESLLQDANDDSTRFRIAGKRLLGREPSASEVTIWKRSLERSATAFAAEPEAARHFLSHGASGRDESLHMETHAAWAALCLNLLNLDETLNKE
jgi:mono/diheme cytochrome c family protein